MKTLALSLLLAILLCGIAPTALGADFGELRVEIRSPAAHSVLPNAEAWVEVEGGASTIGGVRQLDIFLVIDTSSSLSRTDPDDYRKAGAIGLVESLPAKSDTKIGVVEFDKRSELVAPLTSDRAAVVAALRNLDRHGSTDLAAGMRKALVGFEQGARPGSSRVMLIFTDGKSKERSAHDAIRKATDQARKQGVSVHSLLLGSDAKGDAILREIAKKTGGSFVQVTDPAKLPEAFLNLRTAGVDHVVVRVGDSAPVTARLIGSTFTARVPVVEGENRIVATATSLHGVTRTDAVTVTVRAPGCAELRVEATNRGQPALSISDRAVEIVLDASRSMWGRMEGRPKMAVAKEILDDTLVWLPSELNLSLRAYGHQYKRELRNCTDTELLVPLARGNRDHIREAIAGLRPNGQTPLGYALQQIAGDLGSFQGERAVVLVTDGIESCGQDPAAAAAALREQGGVPVHVIGFGIGNEADEDLASLRSIAEASGGRFLTAHSASELRDALSIMVGTSYQVWRDATPVAEGALGDEEAIRLPAGDYRVRLASSPPQEVPIRLVGEEQLRLVWEREDEGVSHSELRGRAEYAACEAPVQESPLAARTDDEPRAARTRVLAIPDGTVEVWQNLRRDRRADWGVVVRHPSVPRGAEMVWSGNDRLEAEQRAQHMQDEMRRMSAPAAPAVP